MLSYFSISIALTVAVISASTIPSSIPSSTTPSTRTYTKNVPSKTAIEIPAIIPAFERIEVASVATFPATGYSNGNAGHMMLMKNVEFGVMGASKVSVGLNNPGNTEDKLEFRIDREDGKLISTVQVSKVDGSELMRVINSSVVPVKGFHDLYVSYSAKDTNVTWFQFEISGPNPEEFYVLTSRFNGQAMSANTPNKVLKEHCRIYPYAYGTHQMFSFEKTAFGSYTIKAKHSGYYMEVRDYLFNETAIVHLNSQNATSQAQEWYIDPAGEGSVKIMSRLSGRCLSLHTGNSHLYQMACLNEPYQKWFFMPVC